jgi:hypothetical protein
MAVLCSPTMPPNSLVFNPTSCAAMPTVSGGYEQTSTRLGLVAWMARTIGE